MAQAYDFIDARKSFEYDRKEFALYLLVNEKINLEQLIKYLQRHKDYDARVRAEMISAYLQAQRKSYPHFKDDSDDAFLETSPHFLRECVVPASNSIQPLTYSNIKEELESRPKGAGAAFRSGFHNFFDSKLWEIIGGIEFHPTAYGNLFGTRLFLSIVREALLGNFEIDRTELTASLVGPAWVAGGDWTPPVINAWANLAPWGALEFASKWAVQGIPTDNRQNPIKRELFDAMIKAPPEAEHLAFAERFQLKASWAFFGITLNVAGEETVGGVDEKPYGRSCDKRICIGIGFDRDNFYPSQKNCTNDPDPDTEVVEDAEFCGGEQKNCIEVTKEDCLKDNNKSCSNKILADCPATCGLYTSITKDDDWPGCKVLPECTDTNSILYLKTDEDFVTTGTKCQDLIITDCMLEARNINDLNSDIKEAYKWCQNHCGYRYETLRSKIEKECTVRPPVLPTASPSLSLSPSEDPISTTVDCDG